MAHAPFDGRPFSLPGGHIVTIADACGLRITCLRGCVWVTVDGQQRDIVLEAGDAYTPRVHQPLVCHALEPSSITAQAVRDASPAPAMPGWLVRLLGDNRAHECTRDAPATLA